MVITGQETEYTGKLRYLVHGLGLEEKVKFVGLVSERDLSRLYSEAALYVYPSPDEDFGMGIIESMAAGTPVVAWNWGGPTLTVKDEVTGFLVTPYEAEEFAARIYDLATNPILAAKMGKAANKRARELFSYERHNCILDEHLAQVTSPSKEPDVVEAYIQVAPDEMLVTKQPSALVDAVRVKLPALLDDSSEH